MASMRQNPPRGSSNGFRWGSAASLCLVGVGGVLLGSQMFGRGEPLVPPDPGQRSISGIASRVADPSEEAALALEANDPGLEIPNSEVVKTSGAPAETPARAHSNSSARGEPPPLRIEGDSPSSSADTADAEARRASSASEESAAPNASAGPADAGAAPAEESHEESDTERQREARDTAPSPEELVPAADCGMIYCNAGYVCCNHSCGTCVPQGESCDETPCDRKIQYPVSIPCGRSTCSNGQICCNTSCGTCIEPGEACDTTPCDNPIQYPIAIYCGRSTCTSGKVCCNLSCGICVLPGETCSHELCD